MVWVRSKTISRLMDLQWIFYSLPPTGWTTPCRHGMTAWCRSPGENTGDFPPLPGVTGRGGVQIETGKCTWGFGLKVCFFVVHLILDLGVSYLDFVESWSKRLLGWSTTSFKILGPLVCWSLWCFRVHTTYLSITPKSRKENWHFHRELWPLKAENAR